MLVAACLLSIAASVAQTTESLAIADFEITAGETKSVAMELTSDMEYVAFQFDMILPEGLSVAQNKKGMLDVTLDDDMIYNHTLEVKKVSETENRYRFLCFSMTNATFFETSGPIVHLTIQADADAPAGTVAGTITDIQFIEWAEAAIEHRFADTTFTVTCKNALPENVTVSVGDAGLATYCPKYGLYFSEATAIAAYKASVSDSTVKLTRVETVAAGEGVLLRSLSGNAVEEELPVAADVEKNQDNAFVGTLENITLYTENGDVTNFILSKVDGVVGFFRVANDGVTLPAGRAYLPVENYNAARAFSIVFNDDTTGIVEVASKHPVGAIYTLWGVCVKTPGKGLYIKNGKKMLVK